MIDLKTNSRILKKRLALVLSPVLSAIIAFGFVWEEEQPEITYTTFVALLMSLWWITEAIPIGATSLIPIILFPVLGILDGKETSIAYVNHMIFLFIGGFIMALAMERWNLHRRIALKILIIFGVSPLRILLGFMFASAFLSMWMSNTATVMMMIPIVLSIIYKLEELYERGSIRRYTIGLLLSIAHACTIGGIATLIGTPPNLSFARIFSIIFPNAPEISFAQWMAYALPITIVMFFVVALVLYLVHRPKIDHIEIDKSVFKEEYQKLGKTTFEEKIVFILFVLLAFLWVFRQNIVLGNFVIPGWSNLFNHPEYFNDGTSAIFISVLLFAIPSIKQKGQRLMNWKTARKLPWKIVLLFGGGFALAQGFVSSGLSLYLGERLAEIVNLNPLNLIMTIVGLMAFLTELTSNTATTEILLPVISGLAVNIKVNPLLLMVPATLSASLAFMLPVATPPNAIIFGSGKVNIWHMVRSGIFLNLAAIIVVSIITYFWAPYVFDIDINSFPSWATGIEKFE